MIYQKAVRLLVTGTAVLTAGLTVTACKLTHSTSPGLEATSTSADSQATVAHDLYTAASSVQGRKAIEDLGRLSFADYFDGVNTAPKAASVVLSDATFSSPSTPLIAERASFLALMEPYESQKAYWDDLPLEPASLREEDFKEALRMLNDYQQGTGGFATALYDNDGGLDANWPKEGQLGLVGIFGTAIRNYNCGQEILAIKSRMTGTMNRICEVSCLSFWETVNRCREVLKMGIAAEKTMESYIDVDAKYKRYVRLAEIAIRVGPSMERFIGILAHGRLLPVSRAEPVDNSDRVDREAGTSRPNAANTARR